MTVTPRVSEGTTAGPSLWLALSIAILLAIPFALLPYPPLVDYPNHLARAHVVASYGSSAALQANYVLALRPVPNLALDIPSIALMQWLEPAMVSRIVLTGLALVFIAAVHALTGTVLGRLSWRGVLGGFFLFSSALLYGFTNYVAGIALFLLATALWLRWRQQWSLSRLLLVSFAFQACYFAHLSTVAFLFLTVTCVAAVDALGAKPGWLRQLFMDLACLALLIVPYIVFPAPGSEGSVVWNSLLGKAIMLLAPLRTYWTWLDAVMMAWCGILGVLAFAQVDRWRVAWPLGLAAAALLLGGLLSPKVAYTSWGADARFVIPAILVGLASLDVQMTSRWRRRLALGTLALLLTRQGAMMAQWVATSHEISRMVRMFESVPRGALILVSFQPEAGWDGAKRSNAFRHVPAYSVITRDAMPSGMFTYSSSILAARSGRPMISDADLATIAASEPGYQYLWTYNRDAEFAARLAAGWCAQDTVGRAVLWKRGACT